jgi:hypothetical protein
VKGKYNEQRISALRGIVINVIGWVWKEGRAICATHRRAAREGKKADGITP